MTDFNEHLEMQLAKIKTILGSKEKEYAKNSNRLHNFNQAGLLLKSSSESALLGMMTKHIVSVVDLLQNPESATYELADEKLFDLANYALLAHYMLYERLYL